MSQSQPDDRTTVESIMADYLERQEASESEGGQGPNPDDYLDRYPEHRTELASFFRNHRWLTDPEQPQNAGLVGTQIGPYLIESEIARGGMGVVYRARQAGLDRPVALKLISNGRLAGAEERTRFRLEAESAAQLQHPGIVPIHEIGSWQGHEYFSMTFIDGPTLQSWVNQAKRQGKNTGPSTVDYRKIAAVVRDIARAVAYAHQQGIIHRDLKPDNILMADGERAMVTDFGLAKWNREGTVITRTGQLLGTPNYMSPEQASGLSDSGPSIDIYSTGAILYALLTGNPPHEGPSVAEVLRSVLQDEPISPRQVHRDVPADLESICWRAIRFDASERYATANSLADELDRFLAGDALEANSSGLIDRVTREIRRDQHQVSFDRWGKTLMLIGTDILAVHVVIYGLSVSDQPLWIAYWIPRVIMLSSIAWIIYSSRGGSLEPRTAAERPVWSIWIGYLATLATMNLMLVVRGIDESALFPLATAMSGFGFIAMAGHVWGGTGVIGLGFLALAVLLTATPATAPLWFGGAWFVAMAILGTRYRGQDRPSASADS